MRARPPMDENILTRISRIQRIFSSAVSACFAVSLFTQEVVNMNIGMMWLDTDAKRPLAEKVRLAADYYTQKYGRSPEICFVNAKNTPCAVDNIQVKPDQSIMRYHFWLGETTN